ncbi:MAG: 5'-methylthioadenosine/adenosylhomocysteine nucleosidase [Spirochaetales bacterium]|jgi:5'-methylthioadenosine/S-adenosylhomocysteine nucleosidase|nr:5'-methylthioadenosine/adenosylhomocysteine nucleosidase [Spirochaetales bacterium]
MTAIFAAMDGELKSIVSAMSVGEEDSFGRARFYRGSLAGKEIVAGKTGIGKSLSAIAIQAAIDRYHPSQLIFIGIAGSLNPDYDIGDIVIARDCMQHDIDLASQGFHIGEIPFEGIRIIPCDPSLVATAARWDGSLKSIYTGRILTGDSFVVDSAHTNLLRKDLQGDAVEMEGASAGLAAMMNDVPFLLIRVISDRSDGVLPEDFKGFLRKSSDSLLGMVTHVLKSSP